MAQQDQLADSIVKLLIPLEFIPGESFTAIWITSAGQSDFIAIVNAWCTGVSKCEEVSKVKTLLILMYQAQEAGHIVAIQQVELCLGKFVGVDGQQFLRAFGKLNCIHSFGCW